MDAGDELELDHVMPAPDRTREIRSAFQAAGTLMLSPVRDLLGEGHSYPESTDAERPWGWNKG